MWNGTNGSGRSKERSEMDAETANRAASGNGVKAPLMTSKPSPVAIRPNRGGPGDELDVLIRARYPVIYVVSWEEERVEQLVARIATARNKKLYIWTCTQGI